MAVSLSFRMSGTPRRSAATATHDAGTPIRRLFPQRASAPDASSAASHASDALPSTARPRQTAHAYRRGRDADDHECADSSADQGSYHVF
jgi:hypothetical protein